MNLSMMTWLKRILISMIAFGAIFGGVAWSVKAAWKPSADDLKNRCREAMESRNWELAESEAVRWAEAAPDSGEPWLQLVEALRRQKKYELALDCLNHIPPGSPQAEAGVIARTELQFGPLNRPMDGMQSCEDLLALNPKSELAQQRLIFFLAMTLQRTRLIRQIRQAIEIGTEPTEAYVYFFFADSLAFSNSTEMNTRWLRDNPDSELFEVAEAIFTAELLDMSVSMDDYAAARAARRNAERKAGVMEKLLKKYPHNAELLAYNIRQRMQVGDVAGAVDLLARVTVDCEDDYRFWRFKGWVHAQRNQPDEAEKAYRWAIKLHPLDWATRNLLAELLQQQERFDEVKHQRELVSRGNELTHELHHQPNARNVAPEILSKLARYAKDCGETQISEALVRRIQQKNKS